jgi:selenophosphate synthase
VPVIGGEILALVARDCVPGGSKANLELADGLTDWGGAEAALRVILSDAQTSGGLLLCVPARNLEKVRQILKEHRTPVAAVIGRIILRNTRRGRAVLIRTP